MVRGKVDFHQHVLFVEFVLLAGVDHFDHDVHILLIGKGHEHVLNLFHPFRFRLLGRDTHFFVLFPIRLLTVLGTLVGLFALSTQEERILKSL